MSDVVIMVACPDPKCFPEGADYRRYLLKPCPTHRQPLMAEDDGIAYEKADKSELVGASQGEVNRAFAELLRGEPAPSSWDQ